MVGRLSVIQSYNPSLVIPIAIVIACYLSRANWNPSLTLMYECQEKDAPFFLKLLIFSGDSAFFSICVRTPSVVGESEGINKREVG